MQVTFLILIIIRLTKMFEKEDNSERRKACFWLFKYLSSLLRFKNIYPYDYYKEILSNYRKQVYELDIERIQEYADIFPKRKMISEALSTEVF